METPRYSKLAALVIASLSATAALAAPQNDTQDTMVVTASGFQQKIQDSAASISVIPRQQIEDKAYRDITDALKDVPGVVVTDGGSKSDISIRGMSSKYTLILVDGKRVDTRGTRPNSDNAGIEQGWLPPLEAIERIESGARADVFAVRFRRHGRRDQRHHPQNLTHRVERLAARRCHPSGKPRFRRPVPDQRLRVRPAG
ncbi:Colicin I receptor precursor [Serratia marcescens]|uniref:Colicin I receptor n=1 Tax=Serratia marcescens TaxID=615 RepID=A0A379Z3R7_SERMA|nr:Colicin I receptor precursor [Serratia marcescens]